MNNNLHQLIQYAAEENWEAMDEFIPYICNETDVIDWSLHTGSSDADGNIRDLAVSLLEKSTYVLQEEDITLLEKLMTSDKNIYVQFRAAFTLFNRGIRSEGVLKKMHEGLQDKDVQEIAKNYLGGSV